MLERCKMLLTCVVMVLYRTAGVSSIGAKIKRLNPHTWPGWFMLPFPSLLLLMLLFVFKDRRSTTSSDVLRSPTTHTSTERRRCGKLHVSFFQLKLCTSYVIIPCWKLITYHTLVLFSYIVVPVIKSIVHTFL